MKNLKRILSLALASVMVMGMMVVGASAAFNDQDEINPVNADAINTMVALKVISGKEGNRFDPEGGVTRAEMATMIAVSLHGGEADFRGTTTTGFTDVDNVKHWAAKYIKYCVDQGILSGIGNNRFNPDANVTAQEAATMILTAMGYRKEMLVSKTSDWAAVINTKAELNGLYNDTAVTDYTQDLDRQNAAQMVFNGITTKTPSISDSYSEITGEHTYHVDAEGPLKGDDPILKTAFKAQMEYGVMEKIEYDDEAKTYTYTLNGRRWSETDKFDGGTVDTLTCAEDYSELFQRQVKVIYSGTAGAKGAVVIGMTAAGNDVLSEGALGLLDARTAGKLDGKTLEDGLTTSTVPYIEFMGDTWYGNVVGHKSGNEVHTYKLIDQDLNGKVDYAVVTPLNVAKVTFVGKDSVTVSYGNTSEAFKFNATDIYSGIAKNDYVTIVAKANTVTGTPVIRELEAVTGTITNERRADNAFKMDGEWYTILPGGPDDLSVTSGTATFAVGDEVEVYTIGSYVVAGGPVGDSSTTTLSNILYVSEVETGKTAGDAIPQTLGKKDPGVDTSVFFTDGSSNIVKTMRVDTYEKTGITGGVSDANDAAIFAAANKKATVPAPGLYSYTVNDNGIYELKAIKEEDDTTYTTAGTKMYVLTAANLPSGMSLDAKGSLTNAWDKDAGKIEATSKYFVADDAIIMLVNTADKKFDVITGKELKVTKSWGTDTVILHKAVSGLGTAQMALVTVGTTGVELPIVDGNTGYGYITASGVGELNGKNYNIRFTVWTDEGEQELVAVDKGLKNSDLVNYAAGSFVTYKTTSTAGQVTDVTAITGAGVAEVAIKGFDSPTNPETIRIDTSALGKNGDEYVTIDEHTVILFVNTADGEGVEGASLVEAFQVAAGVYTKNAYIKVDATDDTVDVLFVDTNNVLDGATYNVAWSQNSATAKGVTATVYALADDTTPVATGTGVAAGTTLTVTVGLSGTATADGYVDVTATLIDNTTIVKTFRIYDEEAFGTRSDELVKFAMPNQGIKSITVRVR